LGWEPVRETTSKIVFPSISKYHGLILSIGRVSGGLILFTVAAHFLPKLPTSFRSGDGISYIYMYFDSSGTDIENQERWLMVQRTCIDHCG
jgi:phosphate transport system permease protein